MHVRANKEEVHEVCGSCGSSASVGSRVRVQLLGNLPFQRDQQEPERVEAQSGQESWPPLQFGIPGIRWRERDVDLDRLERLSSERAFHVVPDSQADSLIPEFFVPNEGEAKVVTGIFTGGTLDVGPGGLCTVYVIGVQVDRDTRTLAESGLEAHPALEGPRSGATADNRARRRSRAAWRRTMYAGADR